MDRDRTVGKVTTTASKGECIAYPRCTTSSSTEARTCIRVLRHSIPAGFTASASSATFGGTASFSHKAGSITGG